MRHNHLLYSDRLTYRLARHSLFWFARYLGIILFNLAIAVVTFLTAPEWDVKYGWILTDRIFLFRILTDMAYCYAICYGLIPRYIPAKKYWSFACLLLIFTIAAYSVNSAFFVSYLRLMNKPWDDIYKSLWYNSISFINSGPPVICAFFLGVSMLRKWYIGQEEKLNLVRANTNAELQLLKAQMHPHFLFNTLNNIYSFILTKHPSAAGLVTKLTGMMRYMNSEGEKDRVPLQKEIQLIRDYINLERVRYGDRLDLQIEINGESSGKWIAPLLMLPFVENSFKHGASVMRGKQWMKLVLHIGENQLRFDLQNSRPQQPIQQNGKRGIGLMNVQKRLELIYPHRHHLQIEAGEMIFRVKMEISLDDQPVAVNEYVQQSSSQNFSYA